MNDKELLTSGERADVLNLINRTLEDNGFNLEVATYEDIDGCFFKISLWKNYNDKPIVIKDKCECREQIKKRIFIKGGGMICFIQYAALL